MIKKIINPGRKQAIIKAAKALKLTYMQALECLAEQNAQKNNWYQTESADYDSDWFCIQTVSDYFDFSYQAVMDIMVLIHQNGLSITTAVDLGAGSGLSTQALSSCIKYISYNNISKRQIKMAKALGLTQSIIAKSAVDIVSRFDAMIALEFFEHFRNPLQTFKEIVAKIRPKYIFMQNSFGAFGYGHYNEYLINFHPISKKIAGVVFCDAVEALGYKIQKSNRVILCTKINSEE